MVGESSRNDHVPKLAKKLSKDIVDERVWGSKYERAEKHLMLDRVEAILNPEVFDSCESVVKDSVGPNYCGENELGLVDSGPLQRKDNIALAQEVSNQLIQRDFGPILQVQSNRGSETQQLGQQGEFSEQNYSITRSQEREGNLGDDQNHISVRLSQIPSINIIVDLNDAACRKRGRRQLSNLIHIQDEVDRESRSETVYSSSDDTIQSSALIIREVRATMMVGSQLGVLYTDRDNQTLRKMIEMENEECSPVRETVRES